MSDSRWMIGRYGAGFLWILFNVDDFRVLREIVNVFETVANHVGPAMAHPLRQTRLLEPRLVNLAVVVGRP